MHPCHACRRHVRSDASACPFCHSVLRDDAAPVPRLAGLLLGLAMMSCGGDDDATDDNATTQMSSTMTGTETSTGTGTSTTNDDNGVSVAAYGDPSIDDSSISNPETSIAESSTTGVDTSGTSSGSSDSSGTSGTSESSGSSTG